MAGGTAARDDAGMPTIQLPEGPVAYEDHGTGRAVVFLHGVLVDGSLWRDVAPAVAEHARAIVPTLPLGAHEHPMRPGSDLSPPGLARLVDRFLAALELEDVVLVANDTGGAIAQIVAANHPERIGALVLTDCDAFDTFPPKMFAYLRVLPHIPGAFAITAQTLRLKALWRLPLTFGLGTKGPLDEELVAGWLRPLRENPAIRPDVKAVLRGAHPRHLHAVVPRFGAFRKPVVLCWSREDRLFPPALAERLAAAFPDSRIDWVDDAWLFVPLDRPDAVIASIRSVLAPASREAATVH